MERLRQHVGPELVWKRVRSEKRACGLYAGDAPLGLLRREKAFGTLARAEAAEGAWTFKRVGCFHPRITVREAGAETEVAVLTVGLCGGGQLTTAGGGSYRWVARGFWRPRWLFLDAAGAPLAEFRGGGWRGRVTLAAAARRLPELSLLVLLGWYCIQLAEEDAMVMAATVVAT